MLNGNSGIGPNQGNTVAGVPQPIGHKLGEPRPWSPFLVIW